jgi:DNA-binding IclR family transcriptional regulator
MVTYLLKVGVNSDDLFTKEAMQQEAYCSGLGKVLLAGLRKDRLDTYLEAGPFIRLTPNTIVSEGDLREEVSLSRGRGYAIDNRETSDEIFCVAVPVKDRAGEVFAAISLSFTNSDLEPAGCQAHIRSLRQAAEYIHSSIG